MKIAALALLLLLGRSEPTTQDAQKAFSGAQSSGEVR
jgi:hypothetical protein